MSKTVHIVGAGGPAGIGLTRCLKDHYEVTGWDDSEYARLAMECGVPDLPEGSLIPADLFIPVPDSLVWSATVNAHDLRKYFLPSRSQVELCQDKARTAEVLGDLAPKTYWLRDTTGAGGKGAQMLTGYLPGRNYSQEFVVYEDGIIAGFQKLRVSYSLKKRTEGLENVGSSAVSVCTDNHEVHEVAMDALEKVSKYTGTPLHGFYGVDLKEDENGVPRVTEINAGRLLTASYSYFWLTGYNLPLVGVRAFLDGEPPVLPPYPLGYGVIRQTDQLPRLVEPSVTGSWLT